MTDGIARSFNWMGLALFPAYVVRPLLLVGAAALVHFLGFTLDATMIMAVMSAAAWIAIIVQFVQLHLRLRTVLPRGVKQYAARKWVVTSLPVMMSWGLYTILTSTDILVLKHFRTAEEVAHYFAAAKTVALVAIIYFAVSAATAHRFTALDAADNHDGLSGFAASTVRWMFWPSLALGAGLIVAGPYVLMIFGHEFVAAYPALVVLVTGHLARASIGPAERILTMLGHQRACVTVYAAAVAFNIGASILLVPTYGGVGAAVATAGAFMLETALLFVLARHRLGIHLFVWAPRKA